MNATETHIGSAYRTKRGPWQVITSDTTYDVVSPSGEVFSRQSPTSEGCYAAHEIAKHQAQCEREHEYDD